MHIFSNYLQEELIEKYRIAYMYVCTTTENSNKEQKFHKNRKNTYKTIKTMKIDQIDSMGYAEIFWGNTRMSMSPHSDPQPNALALFDTREKVYLPFFNVVT